MYTTIDDKDTSFWSL